jgi:hypothetical protein
MAIPVEAAAVVSTPGGGALTMRKIWVEWWLRLEALVPFIFLLAILCVLLWFAVVLWPHL